MVAGQALAATVGAGATAELGAMRISEEIDALEVMGIKSISYLVSTRIMAGFIVIIPLYAMAIIMSFLSAQVTTTFFYGQSIGTYEHYFRTFLRPDDVFWSFVQAIIISVIVMLNHCYYGYFASGGRWASARPSAGRCAPRWSQSSALSCSHRWRSTASTRTST